jgi:hypothetical protein
MFTLNLFGKDFMRSDTQAKRATKICCDHRWPLSPISVTSDIGLSLISEYPTSDREISELSFIGYPTSILWRSIVAECYSARLQYQGACLQIQLVNTNFWEMSDIGMDSDVDIGTLPISE